MTERKIRILLGKLGKGHKKALLDLARCFGEAGFEVIYTELQDPEALISSALQESVDHIGITTLPGADIGIFEQMREILKREGAGNITISAGGILDEKDISMIKETGVMKFFPRGTAFEELIEWAGKNIKGF